MCASCIHAWCFRVGQVVHLCVSCSYYFCKSSNLISVFGLNQSLPSVLKNDILAHPVCHSIKDLVQHIWQTALRDASRNDPDARKCSVARILGMAGIAWLCCETGSTSGLSTFKSSKMAWLDRRCVWIFFFSFVIQKKVEVQRKIKCSSCPFIKPASSPYHNNSCQ